MVKTIDRYNWFNSAWYMHSTSLKLVPNIQVSILTMILWYFLFCCFVALLPFPYKHRHTTKGSSLLGAEFKFFLCVSRDVRKLARGDYYVWNEVERTCRNDLHQNWGQGHGERIWQDFTSPSNMHQGNWWLDSCGMPKLRFFRNIQRILLLTEFKLAANKTCLVTHKLVETRMYLRMRSFGL